MPRIKLHLLSAILLVLTFIQISCRKHEKIDTSPGLKLSFSTDTVFFDTVFPTIGSITKRLIVHNPNDNKVSVSKISLFGGKSSCYQINIDGISGAVATNIEIPGKDSIFIFVKVTIDPQDKSIPFVVADSIGFETNGSAQQVKLVAWGRDAIFHKNGLLKGNNIWDSLKAHVIYGFLRVDTNASLTITEGTRVYFHMGSYMAVSFHSTLKIQGTSQHFVTFQGDRLDPFYKDLPGQWQGIYLEQGSQGHDIDHALIKNGVFGFLVDQPQTLTTPMLTINNSLIKNMTSKGIYALGASIVSTNCVICDCGSACVDLNYGGSYDFRQLTVGNYWYASVRHTPSVYVSNFAYDTSGVKLTKPLLKAYFGNAIIYGTNDDELKLDSVAGIPFEYQFDHAIIRSKMSMTNHSRFVNCTANLDPRFVDVSKLDYRIDSISPAIDRGTDLGINTDILGNSRVLPPDLGAYEYVKIR